MTLQEAVEALQRAHAEGRHAWLHRTSQVLLTKYPGEPVLWKLHGAACHALGDITGASRAWQQGLTLAPEDAGLWFNLADAHRRLGQVQAAKEAYQKALMREPGDIQVCHGLAQLDSTLIAPAQLQMLSDCAKDPAQANKPRRIAWYTLGKVLEDRGQFEAGFECYRQANALVLQLEPACEPFWPQAAYTAMSESFMARYRRQTPAPYSGPRPIIITGLPRSGKSLVERLLTAHPAVLAGGEWAGLARYLQQTAATLGKKTLSLAALAQAVLDDSVSPWPLHQPQQTSPFSWITDTDPANLGVLGLLPSVDPAIPVVLCRRDPLDLACACYFKSFKSLHSYTSDLPTLGRTIARAEQLIERWVRSLPNPLAVIDYESLVRAPEQTTQHLYDFLGLPDLSDCQRVNDQASSAPITAALIGSGQRFQDAMRPAMQAYAVQKARTR